MLLPIALTAFMISLAGFITAIPLGIIELRHTRCRKTHHETLQGAIGVAGQAHAIIEFSEVTTGPIRITTFGDRRRKTAHVTEFLKLETLPIQTVQLSLPPE